MATKKWQSLLQRGLDGASEAADVVAHKLSMAADPRARLLRKRKWALRLGLFFGFACVFWFLVTGLLATWNVPFWALLITGLVAAGAAFPATLLLLRYRWLKATPLPAQRPAASRRLPPPGSAARPAMSALGASERGFYSLLGVIERAEILPPEEIRELTVAANATATTMSATAAEVVSIERAVSLTPQSQSYLVPSINAFTTQLSNGVRQYNEMVTAAAHLVSSATGGSMPASPMSQQHYRAELTNATDRLMGWAQAFDELGELRRA
ncbi:membrane protein [soil metagenome]